MLLLNLCLGFLSDITIFQVCLITGIYQVVSSKQLTYMGVVTFFAHSCRNTSPALIIKCTYRGLNFLAFCISNRFATLGVKNFLKDNSFIK